MAKKKGATAAGKAGQVLVMPAAGKASYASVFPGVYAGAGVFLHP